ASIGGDLPGAGEPESPVTVGLAGHTDARTRPDVAVRCETGPEGHRRRRVENVHSPERQIYSQGPPEIPGSASGPIEWDARPPVSHDLMTFLDAGGPQKHSPAFARRSAGDVHTLVNAVAEVHVEMPGVTEHHPIA